MTVTFSGFGMGTPEYLVEGEWATGTIALDENNQFGTSFILPYDGAVKKICVLFSTSSNTLFEDGAVITPFVCLAISNSANLTYTILQDTMTYTKPYAGGVEHPVHTTRRGCLDNLDVDIPEGSLVAIVAGIMAENVTSEQYSTFSASGVVFLEQTRPV